MTINVTVTNQPGIVVAASAKKPFDVPNSTTFVGAGDFPSAVQNANNTANAAILVANSAFIYSNVALVTANSALVTANSAYNRANSSLLKTGDTMTGALIVKGNTFFTIQDPTDTSKQAQFNLGSIAVSNTRSYSLPNADGFLATLGNPGTQIFTGAVTVNGTATFGTTFNLNTPTGTVTLNGTQTTGVITMGGASATGNITLGQSTATQNVRLAVGATSSGNTKTVDIGTSGVANSTTNINIGSAISGALGTINLRAPLVNIGNSATSNSIQFQVVGIANAINYLQVTGSANGVAPTISMQGSDANISFALQPKGTGAIDLAAGSSGVNISNGGTVTAITRTAAGSGYTTNPSIAISAPTTAGGVQATATCTIATTSGSTIASGGTGYTVGDTLTVVGGTFTTAATFTVSTVSSGVITAIALVQGGVYTALPTNPVSVTGGTGSSATLNLTAGVINSTFTITNAGSGYVEQPTVTFSGGGGSGAAAYASIGATATIKGLFGGGSAVPLQFNGPSGTLLQLMESGTTSSPSALVLKASGGSNQIYPNGTNASLILSSGGTGIIQFYTNTLVQEQFRVAHTASAVNYVQVTGGGTNSTTGPIISAQGSDINIPLTIVPKGNSAVRMNSGALGANTGNTQDMFLAVGTNSNANYLKATMIRYADGTSWTTSTTRFGLVTDVTQQAYIDFNPANNNFGIAITSASTAPIQFITGSNGGALGVEQLRVSHTANANNYLQVTGSSGSAPSISAQGSDANITLQYATKGTGQHIFITRGATGQFRVIDTGSAVNYGTVTGAIANSGPTFSVNGTSTDISLALQTKGAGAIDLVAGSSGINASNGTTVTAITRTAAGSAYTSIPSVVISAPTGTGGVTATANATMFVGAISLVSGGTGYSNNDILSLVGGTFTSAGSLTVTGISGNVITSATILSGGNAYTTLPTNPISVTGGTGANATFNVTSWSVSTIPIATAGSGYVEQPTVSFSGGGGSGAAAYATVGSGTVVRSLGSTLDFYTPNASIGLRVEDSGGTGTAYWRARAGGGSAQLLATAAAAISSTGTNQISFFTNGISQEQFRVAHTASAVNYVQVTGAATTAQPLISAQGSDTNISFSITSKGVGNVNFWTNNSASRQFAITHTAGTIVNYATVTGSAAGAAPVFSVAGTDTNIDLSLQAKGSGNVITSNTFVVSNTTPATSNATGALRVSGGAGIIGDVYANNYYYSSGRAVSYYNNQYLLSNNTTTNVETELFTSTGGRVPVPLGKTLFYKIDIAARRTNAVGDYASFTLQGIANNTSGLTTDIGGIVETIIYRSNINYNVDARANSVSNTINIYVTGVAGHNIAWSSIITTIEV